MICSRQPDGTPQIIAAPGVIGANSLVSALPRALVAIKRILSPAALFDIEACFVRGWPCGTTRGIPSSRARDKCSLVDPTRRLEQQSCAPDRCIVTASNGWHAIGAPGYWVQMLN